MNRSKIYKEALKHIDLKNYVVSEVDAGKTHFYVFVRKNKVIRSDRIPEAIKLYWPKIERLVGLTIPEAAVVDFDAPLTGGALAPYVVAIYSSGNIEPDFQKLIKQTSGWSEQTSTSKYIAANYASFPDPEKAYIEDMVAHELGHLFFGFGKSSMPADQLDWWFPLGLGLLYDRAAWSEEYKEPSPLFSGNDAQLEKFKKLPVDQHLIRPNTSRDKEFSLNRLQIYGHGKSLAFLKAARARVGAQAFDKAVQALISTPAPRECSYDSFVKLLSDTDRGTLHAVEKEFDVR